MSEISTIITAIGGFLLAASAAAVKIWSVIKEVNDQLEEIAKEAEARRKAAEEEAAHLNQEVAKLRLETAALRAEVHELKRAAAERDEELKELLVMRAENYAMNEQVEILEQQLAKAIAERDSYKEKWLKCQEMSE